MSSYRQTAAVKLMVSPDLGALGIAAAQIFAEQATLAVQKVGRFAVALSGGSTPKAMFKALKEGWNARLDWKRIHLFWGDERCVPPNDAASNYHMAKEQLIDHLPIPNANIHRIHAEEPPAAAAAGYENELRRFFRLAPGEWPRFDLLLLGIGEEGHTASLFPDTAALHETTRIVVSTFVSGVNAERITLTFPAINAAAFVIVLASGTRKCEIIRTVLDTTPSPKTLPMHGVHPNHGQLVWILDADAAHFVD